MQNEGIAAASMQPPLGNCYCCNFYLRTAGEQYMKLSTVL